MGDLCVWMSLFSADSIKGIKRKKKNSAKLLTVKYLNVNI